MDVHERRRVVLATAFTLVALPAIWLFDRDDPAASSSVAAVGIPTPEVAEAPAQVTVETEVPVFLDNTVVVVAPAVIDVALPDAPGPNEIEGTASYKRFDATLEKKCSAPRAPSGVLLTITNIDNGLSITCRNTMGVSIPYGITVGIDTDLFIEIADLADSPVPIRLSW
jgi:hypothetical protein